MQIRPANHDDLPVILALGMLMHQDSTFRAVPFDPVVAETTVRELLASEEGYVRVASDHDLDMPAAFMLGFVFPAWFGRGTMAGDLAIYVPPPLRKRGLAGALLQDFTRWAKARGAIHVSISNTAGADDGQFQALGASAGYARSGSVMYQLNAEGAPDVQA